MRKIAILSDVHGNNLLLEEVLDCLKKQNIEEYIFCGDLVGGFEDNEVLDIAKSKTKNIIVGNGEVENNNYDNKSWENLDQWKPRLYTYKNLSKENTKFISQLQIFKIIEIEGYRICISHGSPYNVSDIVYPNSYQIFDRLIDDMQCDIYLFGHTHKPFKTEYKDKIFANPGSVCCSSHGKPISSYGILCLGEGKIDYTNEEYNYDFEKLKNYYLRSNYHKECLEWSNLFIYTLKDGNDYFSEFIKFVSEKDNIDKSWYNKFEEFMKLKKIDILK